MKKISPKIADFQEFSLLHCNSWRHALQICKETPDGSATLQILQSAKSERALVGSKSSVANLVDPARHLLATLLLYCENPAIFSTEALKRGFLCFCYQTEQRKDNAILLSHIFQPTPQNYWFPILKVKFEILPFFNNFYMKSHLLIIF